MMLHNSKKRNASGIIMFLFKKMRKKVFVYIYCVHTQRALNKHRNMHGMILHYVVVGTGQENSPTLFLVYTCVSMNC